MKLLKKITFLIAATAILTMLAPNFAYARKDSSQAENQSAAESQNDEDGKIKAESAAEFAERVAPGSNVLPALQKAADKEKNKPGTKNIIQCGSELCDLDTQFCYQEYSTWHGPGSGVTSCSCYDKAMPLQEGETSQGTSRTPYTTTCSEIKTSTGTTNETIPMHGSDGHEYQVHIGDNVTIQYSHADKNQAIRGCEVLPVKLYSYRKCFFCPLVGVIYSGSAQITDMAFDKLAGAFKVLLALGLGIWIALQVLTQVSSLTKQDAPKFLAALIKQSYKVAIAFILLQYSGQIFKYAINPILETGLVFGKNMLTTTDIFKGANYDKAGKYIQQAVITPGKHYGTSTYVQLEEFVVAVQQEIAFMQTIGTSLMCTGGNLMMLKEATAWQKTKGAVGLGTSALVQQFGYGFQMLIQGATLAIFGFLLSLAFVFYLIDAIVQFGVVGGLLPFLIASWPFKATSKYTSTGTQMLLNSAFLFLFIGLVISANIHLINAALDQTRDEKQSEQLSLCSEKNYFTKNQAECEKVFNETPRMGALYEIAEAFNGQDSSKLKELTNVSAMGFLILVFCCIFGFKFTGQAISLADKFASGGIGKPTAPGIATMGASFAKSAALKTTERTREAIGNKTERAVGWVASLPGRGIGALWRTVRGKNAKTGAAAGANPQAAKGQANTAASSAGAGATAGRPSATLSEGRATTAANKETAAGKPVLNEGKPSASGGNKPRFNEGKAENEIPTEQQGEVPVENTQAAPSAPETGEANAAAEQNEAKKTSVPKAGAPKATLSEREATRAAPQKSEVKEDHNNRQAKGGSGRNRNNYGRRK